MLTNYHTHSRFCDGDNTLEEIVLSAIDKGFDVIGFSGHGYTPFDLSYCMKNTDEYLSSLKDLKEKYKDKIEVCIGIEEDALSLINRADYEYIIGSCHYLCVDGKFYEVDSADGFKKCLEIFNNDAIAFANAYYQTFCDYIKKRKPDIVGHFDLITKYDETDTPLFLNNKEYLCLSEKYMFEALNNDVIFEVNTGAISRGYRTSVYPHENLLHLIKKNNGKIILSSDSHNAKTLDFYFDDAKAILKDIGFNSVWILIQGEFKKDYI